MLTVLEVIQLSTEYLSNKGVESPRTNAELLLADILKCKRLDLYLAFDKPIGENEKTRYREYIARRGKREPLQYILGKVEFYGMDFIVTPAVLIPRPETEILVEQVIESFKSEKQIRMLDIGTGSGNIPICITKHLQNVESVSIDISNEAIQIAEKNLSVHDLNGRLTFKNIDVFNDGAIQELGMFDLIVSNPPYVAKDEYNNIQPEILNYEPLVAVTDIGDGYKFYKRIADVANQQLSTGGKLFVEVGINQSIEVKRIFEQHFSDVTIVKDYLNIDRVIIAEKK